MKKRIISLAVVLAMLACFASCGKVTGSEKTEAESASESVTQASSESLTEETAAVQDEAFGITETTVDTAEEQTTSEKATTEKATTEKTTAEKTSSVKETSGKTANEKTTVQKVTSAVKTAVTTTKKVATTVSYTGETTTQTKTYRSDLKYGVDKYRTVVITYGYKSDGSKYKISETEKSVVYDRSTYSAEYSDLLPAANQNRQTYASYINEVLRLTNEMRAEGGLEPLTLDTKLTEQANVRAEEVAWAGAKAHGHTRPNTRSYTSIFEENGFTTGTVGENVGWGYSTPAAVCAAWKASETHYENIMNPDFKSIGIGVAADPDPAGNLCWIQHFYSK